MGTRTKKVSHLNLILLISFTSFCFTFYALTKLYLHSSNSSLPLNGVTINCALISGVYEKLYESIPAFEKKTGAKVNIVYKADGFALDKKLKKDFETNSVNFDVIWDHSSFFSQYIPYLEPLDKYFSQEDLVDFLPGLLNTGRKDDHLWQIPRQADISALYYRTDLFNDPVEKAAFKKKYGKDLKVPETYDEFLQTAIFFSRDTTLYGTQFPGKEEALTGRFYELLVAFGGNFLTSEGSANFNTTSGINAALFLKKLYASGAMPPDTMNYLWDDVIKNFKSGNVAMYMECYDWFSFLQNPKTSDVAGKFDIARQPSGPTGIHGGWGGLHGFSITKSSKNPKAAAELIKFLTNSENQYAQGKLGFLPTRKSVWDKLIHDSSSSKDPLVKKRLELAKLQLSEDFITPPLMAEWIPASNLLYPKLQSIILGDEDAQTALDEVASEINKLLDKSK